MMRRYDSSYFNSSLSGKDVSLESLMWKSSTDDKVKRRKLSDLLNLSIISFVFRNEGYHNSFFKHIIQNHTEMKVAMQ